MKRKVLLFLFAAVITLVTITVALADDGCLIRKRMSHTANPSVPGYIDEAEHAFIGMMKFYVPAQAADGTVAPIDYFNVDVEDPETGVAETTHEFAKPLIGVYLYGPFEEVEGTGFTGHGRRDAYGAVSLDDGLTWKKTNLSQSADLSSSTVRRRDIPLFSDIKKRYYPGDVVNIFHAIAGNKVVVAWPSRYCGGGQPNYALDTDDPSEEQEARRAGIAEYLGINLDDPSPDDLYLLDMYGVAGHQGSVDYADDKYEPNHEVGEVPYSCLWTARGVLVDGDDPRTAEVTEESFMRWFNTERLTSGVRDVNRIETKCVSGAGCVITWQEDPEGLRPGQAEGPGEGWSGAIANHQTDAMARRVWWIDDYISDNPDNVWQIGGGAGGGGGGGGGGEDPVLDLDITVLNVTESIRLRKRVSISLSVVNNGEISGQAVATVEGVQNGRVVYNESQDIELDSGANATITFPRYRTRNRGEILWTATITDGDEDVDIVTASTLVK